MENINLIEPCGRGKKKKKRHIDKNYAVSVVGYPSRPDPENGVAAVWSVYIKVTLVGPEACICRISFVACPPPLVCGCVCGSCAHRVLRYTFCHYSVTNRRHTTQLQRQPGLFNFFFHDLLAAFENIFPPLIVTPSHKRRAADPCENSSCVALTASRAY